MRDYKCVFSINGTRMEMFVKAGTQEQARKIIEAKFSGQKIMWHGLPTPFF